MQKLLLTLSLAKLNLERREILKIYEVFIYRDIHYFTCLLHVPRAVGHVARVGDKRDVHSVLVGRRERNRLLGRH